MTSSKSRPSTTAGNVAEDRRGDRVDLANTEVGVDQIDAERRLIQEGLILLAALAEGTPRLLPEARQLAAATPRTPAARAR